MVSSLFPQLPQHSRAPFRLGVTALVVAVAACVLLRLPAGMIAFAAFGLPLLFVTYLRESDAFHDLSVRTLLLTVVLGAGLGAGWALVTGTAVAREYDMPMGDGVAPFRIIRDGLGVPLGAMLLMILPVAVIRLLGPRTRESLEGFAIGALGALAFIAAATLSRLAPQVDDGMVDHDRPLSGLLIQAGLQAVAVPVTAAATGGLAGAAMWFTRPANYVHQHPRYLRAALALAAVTVTGCYATLGLIDVVPVPQGLVLTVHLVVMMLAVLALRVVLQLALLNEVHDEIRSGETLVCPHCDQAVPDMPFCPRCGVASRASSPSSRTARRHALPVRRTGYRRLLGTWGAGVTVLAVALVAVSALVSSPPARYVCPPDCGSPPTSEPIATNPRFTAPDGAFSVSYPVSGAAYAVTTADDGVTADFLAGDGGTMQLIGRPAEGRTPKEIAAALVEDTYPDTEVDYEIPNAMVGYQPGYGMVLDSWPQNGTGDYMRLRVVILAAVKNDLALIAIATGPYREYSPDFSSGKPSGADLALALDMGKYVNSFRWRGDPRR
ncbi:zinc ribbon domain-containing protein [Mycobacterium sp. CBMA247]|nr:zinc ribbon domain-containing protein [Mycolicibacterium sp. CBMA 329]MUL86982.1 zinc ribbon domain-containing protein [Mycolicibacterium sp. CBMA 331]MUL98735.1 zinc ribbon domain-containing protein [Mycolicibacterium sp. CBMA 334]MUM25597.1 zinc ribbon domain-containing protein [Mycolicibacterium sp. CBMA 295]MUM37279.1 zinc ribbon domain-containing protein [Mycolicibacterium sp. CBMA 247]MUM43047.1 zinc ribbon domain-containing protein [Mycolicibacterium sp. CBMA 294]